MYSIIYIYIYRDIYIYIDSEREGTVVPIGKQIKAAFTRDPAEERVEIGDLCVTSFYAGHVCGT